MKNKQMKILTVEDQQVVSGGNAFNLDPFYQVINQPKTSFGNELETQPKAYITLGLHEDGGTFSTF